MSALTPDRDRLRVSGAFVRARPGDLLVHPGTQQPLARVVSMSHAMTAREGKPTRHRIVLVAEDVEDE